MKQTIKSLLLLILALLSACNSRHNNETKAIMTVKDFIQSQNLESVERVRVLRMISWQNLDSRHILISASQKNNYLVELSGACFNLESANQIALKQRQEFWLSRHFDSIVAITLHSKDECNIQEIYPITKEQKKQLAELR